MNSFLKYFIFAKNLIFFSKNTFYIGYLKPNLDDNFSYFDKNSKKNNEEKNINLFVLKDEFSKSNYEKTLFYDEKIELKEMRIFACVSFFDKILLVKTKDDDNFKKVLPIHKKILLFYLFMFFISGLFISISFVFVYLSMFLGVLLVNCFINFGILKKQIRFLNMINFDDFK